MSAIQQILAAFGAASEGPPPTLPTVTWNPADKDAGIQLSNGNLTATKITANELKSVRATHSVASTDPAGYYFELNVTGTGGNAPYMLAGLAASTVPLSGHIGLDAKGYAYYQETGEKYNAGVGSAYGSAYTDGAVIGVMFKAGKVWFSRNGAVQGGGNPAAGTGEAFTVAAGDYFPAVSLYRFDGTSPHEVVARFRSADFAYSPPAGFGPWGG